MNMTNLRRFFTILALAACFVPGLAFAEVVGIATNSTLPAYPAGHLGACIYDSMKGVKGHYWKLIPDFGPFLASKAGIEGKSERIDTIYHFSVSKPEGNPAVIVTQYYVPLGKSTATAYQPMDRFYRPCDAAVMALIDLQGKESTFMEKARPALHQGRELAAQGRFDEAGHYYNQAARMIPNAGHIYREMGQYLENARRFDWAIEWYSLAVKQDENEIQSYLNIARIESNQYNLENAIGYMELALTRAARPPVIYAELGKLYQEMGRYELAWRIYEKAFKLDGRDTDVLSRLVQMEMKDKQWAKAGEHQKQYMRLRPDDRNAVGVLLQLYMKAENYNEAERMVRSFLQVQPDEPGWISMLAEILEGRQDYDGAYAQYTRLLEIAPDSANARMALAKIDYRRRRFEPAKTQLQYVLADSSYQTEALRVLGRIQELEKNYEEAIDSQRKVILYESELMDSDLLRLFALGRKAGSSYSVEKAVNELIPYKSKADQRRIVMALAEAMVADGRKTEASRYLQSRMHLLDRHGPAYVLTGTLLLDEGKFEDAERVFRSAVFYSTDPNMPLAIGQIYHRLHRYSEAQDFYQYARNRNEDSAKILLLYLETNLLNDNLDEAIWSINDLNKMKLSPFNQQYLACLQVIYAELKGNADFAKSSLAYGLKMLDKYGQTQRLNFSDFRPLIQSKFDAEKAKMLFALLDVFEGKITASDFRGAYPGI